MLVATTVAEKIDYWSLLLFQLVLFHNVKASLKVIVGDLKYTMCHTAFYSLVWCCGFYRTLLHTLL